MRDAVAAALAAAAPLRGPVAVALSGGRDSVALLDAACRAVEGHRVPVIAAHVHHGLSPHADAWRDFCVALAGERGIDAEVAHVAVSRAPRRSVEASARQARYAALAAIARQRGAALVLLAHHADDQAETLLLQLLRGAGPRGLAAMPATRDIAGVPFVRPWLRLPRADIDAYVARHGLRHVDDDSNADARLRRNALRRDVAPVLRAQGGYPETLARAASQQAEAARLLDELAELDAAGACDQRCGEPGRGGMSLRRAGLRALAPHRARNLLRWFLQRHGLRAPSAARLDAMYRQLVAARDDARVRLLHDGMQLGLARPGLVVVHPRTPAAFEQPWRGEDALTLPHGTVRLVADGDGTLDRTRLFAQPVTLRSRQGGERFCTGPGRPRRALKLVLQDARVPAWARAALPLVFAGDVLAAVPDVGVDPAFRVAAGTPGWRLLWEPSSGAAPGADA